MLTWSLGLRVMYSWTSQSKQRHRCCRGSWLFSGFRFPRPLFRCPFRNCGLLWFQWICTQSGQARPIAYTRAIYCDCNKVACRAPTMHTCIGMIHPDQSLILALKLERAPLLDLAEHKSHIRYTELPAQMSPSAGAMNVSHKAGWNGMECFNDHHDGLLLLVLVRRTRQLDKTRCRTS